MLDDEQMFVGSAMHVFKENLQKLFRLLIDAVSFIEKFVTQGVSMDFTVLTALLVGLCKAMGCEMDKCCVCHHCIKFSM